MEGAHRTGRLLLELISNCIVGSHFHLRVVCTVKRSMQLGTRREQRHPWMPGSQPPISVFSFFLSFFRDDLLRCLPGLDLSLPVRHHHRSSLRSSLLPPLFPAQGIANHVRERDIPMW